MDPLISVIIPVYNVEKYLDRCIESVVNQTYTNLEIILVDDGSLDNCPMMCDAWAEKDSRIKVIHKENGGVSSARNMGIDIALGQYVHFMDSDDYLDENTYSKMIEHMTGNDFLVTNAFSLKNKESLYNMCRIKEKNEGYVSINLILQNIGYSNCWNKLFDLDIIKQNNIKFNCEIDYGEDYYFAYEYSKYANNLVVIDEPLYFYNDIRCDSVTNVRIDNYYRRWQVTKMIYKNENRKDVCNAAATRLVEELSKCMFECLRDKKEKIYLETIKEIRNCRKDKLLNSKLSTIMKFAGYFPFTFKIMYKIRKSI